MDVRTRPLASLFAGLALAAAVVAQEKGDDETPARVPEHGGHMIQAGEVELEVVCTPSSIIVYAYDEEGGAVDLKDVKATYRILPAASAAKKSPGAGKKLKYVHPSPRRQKEDAAESAGHLVAPGKFQRIPELDFVVSMSLVGLPGVGEGEVKLQTPFRLSRMTRFSCPMNCVPPEPDPGYCAMCKMALVGEQYVFACEEHGSVTAHSKKAKCWKCKSKLRPRQSSYQAEAEAEIPVEPDQETESEADPDEPGEEEKR